MNRKAFTTLIVLFMVFIGLQFATAVSAAKIVDQGTKYSWDGQNGWTKSTWKTYQYRYSNGKINNNFIISYIKRYAKGDGKPDVKAGKYIFSFNERISIANVSANAVKITDWTNCELGPGTTVTYDKTKLTAARYYWRVYRPIVTAW